VERPTCETCVYWKKDEEATAYGECHRLPPVNLRDECVTFENGAEIIINSGFWTETNYYDWCGEHSDFPAYLASRRTGKADERSRLNLLIGELTTRSQNVLIDVAQMNGWTWIDEINEAVLKNTLKCGAVTIKEIVEWRDRHLADRRTAASSSADLDATRE
jgi:hypothetical protein